MKPAEQVSPHEPANKSFWLIAWLLAAVAAPVALVYFATSGGAKGAQPGAEALEADLTRGPRPEQMLAEHRESMQEWLESYGWVDREAGIARVPIEEGMQAVLREGLPAREKVEQQR